MTVFVPLKMTEFLETIRSNIVKIGDMDMAYKTLGNGTPLLLIVGAGSTMNVWALTLLKELLSKHTAIIFDNRGMDCTTSGTKEFSTSQFSEDSARLLEYLKIDRAHVLGQSMGGMIALELSISHADKVAKPIIVGSDCGASIYTYE